MGPLGACCGAPRLGPPAGGIPTNALPGLYMPMPPYGYPPGCCVACSCPGGTCVDVAVAMEEGGCDMAGGRPAMADGKGDGSVADWDTDTLSSLFSSSCTNTAFAGMGGIPPMESPGGGRAGEGPDADGGGLGCCCC